MLLDIGFKADTESPLYTDTRYNVKIRCNDNMTGTSSSLKRWWENIQEHFI